MYVHRTLHWLKVAAAPVRAVGRLARRVARRQPLLTRTGLVAAVGSVLAAGDVIDLSRLQPAWRTPVAVAVAVVAAVGWVWPAVTPVKDPRPGRRPPEPAPEVFEVVGGYPSGDTPVDQIGPPPPALQSPHPPPGNAVAEVAEVAEVSEVAEGDPVTQEIPVAADPTGPAVAGPCADPE